MGKRLLDMERFVQTGEGANGASYDSLEDSSVMVKMYNEGYDLSMITQELDVARKVYDNGISSPKPGELVTDGHRTGILFHRIPEKKSFARAVADNPGLLKPLAEEFAGMCLNLHNTKDSKGDFPDIKKQYLYFLEKDFVFSAEEKEKIAAFINAAPDSGTCLHGDMHFGNAVISGPADPVSTDPNRKTMWIDLGCFAHGYPLFDLGMTYIVTHVNEDSFTYENFHFHHDTAAAFWDAFAPVYFKGMSHEEIEATVLPYAAVKALLVEYNCREPMFPNFVELYYKSILK